MKIMLLVLTVTVCQAFAETQVEQGRAIAIDRNKGNCLSCHFVMAEEMTGTVGPPLVQMKSRYPDRDKLRAQIWDAAEQNSESVMPPYGRHSILNEDEIDLVLEWVYSL